VSFETRRRVIFDGTALLRGAVLADDESAGRLEDIETQTVIAVAPELIWGDVAHALARYVGAGAIAPGDAREILERLRLLPIRSYRMRDTATAALAIAIERGVSAHDAFYVALAEAAEGVLVTADRHLAAAYQRAELLA
jgi:predicted nucleic acid-binding protein